MEADAGSLNIYDEGSKHAEIIGYLNSTIYDTKISSPRNQIFVILDINGEYNSSLRLNATVFKSKLFDKIRFSLVMMHTFLLFSVYIWG